MTRNRNGTARRRFVQLLGAGTALGIGGPTVATAHGNTDNGAGAHSKTRDGDSGLVTLETDADFETTVARVEPALEERDLMLVTSVDHAANADTAGADLPPTTLFLFGNPAVGTPLMQASRSIAIDLPQKLLVWAADGNVYVTYNDPHYLARRHDIEEIDERITGVEALSDLAHAVANDG